MNVFYAHVAAHLALRIGGMETNIWVLQCLCKLTGGLLTPEMIQRRRDWINFEIRFLFTVAILL